MEILNARHSVLSNYEVMEILQKFKDSKKKHEPRNLATVTYETLQFLETAPCKDQTREGIASFLEEVKPYKLKVNECLMMVNDPPSNALHIQLIVEDSEERLTEDQVNEILELVIKYLVPPRIDEEEEVEDEEDGDEVVEEETGNQ